MREIKFRALKDDMSNPIFVYGQLVYDASGTARITHVDFSLKCLTFHTCINGTEGQYTGLKDKNGKEIYEGDIVKCHYFYEAIGEGLGVYEAEEEITGEISFQELGLWIQCETEADSGYLLWINFLHEESLEIIGNIHENPELL